MLAQGTFDVTLTPQADDALAGAGLSRLHIDKQFSGDLIASSVGQMLSALTPVEGSAGYVALERVTGTLHSRRGSFVLQHSGTLTRGSRGLTITVVPDSGTDELAGLSGQMQIIVTPEQHTYQFEYTLL